MSLAPITGLAIGDALGMPFETETPLAERLIQWDGSFGPSSFHKLGPGQWTDDTQMSLALMGALTEKKTYTPSLAATKYLEWFLGKRAGGIPRGVAKTTGEAMQRLASGRPWDESGIEGSEGNGSAMRAAPFGLLHRRGARRMEIAANDARLDASITHRSLEASEGSAAIAMAVSHLAAGGAKPELLDAVIPLLAKSQIKTALEKLRLLCRSADIREVISEMDWMLAGPAAHVVQSVPAAFAFFLYAENFAEVVEGAVRGGGDTDSVAAMAGAMAGAHFGYEAIPDKYLAGLEDAEGIRRVELTLILS